MALHALSKHPKTRFQSGTRDLRNWEIRDRRSDQRLGTVDDVLVDENGYTRYLDLAVEGRKDHVLMPPGNLEAARGGNVLYTEGLPRETFDRLPAYDRDPSRIDSDYEQRVEAAYDQGYEESGYFHERPDYRAHDWSRRDEGEGHGEARGERGEVAELSELGDVKVASGEPDPRGWEVVDRDGNHYGTIRHLIGDTGAMRVRYLALAPAARHEDRREVLIPAGHAALDRGRREVRVDALDGQRIETLPRWEKGTAIDRATARRVEESFAGAYTGERRYHHPRYRDEGVYGPYTGTEEETPAPRNEQELAVRRRPRQVREVTTTR